MSKGRHKGKIQLSIGLPVQTAHPTYPMKEAIKKKKRTKQKKTKLQFSTLAKTLSAAQNNSTFLKFNTALLILQKIERTERRAREGENKRTKLQERGWGKVERRRREEEREGGGVHLHTKIIHKDIGTRNAKIKNQ